MTSNQERAAELMMSEFLEAEDHPDIATLNEAFRHVARALDAKDFITPDGMTVEWEAVVAWRNPAGQSEQTTGHGATREEALADARGQDRWLTTATEIAHRCEHRHVTEWQAEETTITEQEASNE